MTTIIHALVAGPPAPENGEGCEPASSAPLRTLDNQRANCRANSGADQAPSDDCKTFAQLRAELALAGGFALHNLADGGGYAVCRWNCSRTLPDLDAVASFLRHVRGAR